MISAPARARSCPSLGFGSEFGGDIDRLTSRDRRLASSELLFSGFSPDFRHFSDRGEIGRTVGDRVKNRTVSDKSEELASHKDHAQEQSSEKLQTIQKYQLSCFTATANETKKFQTTRKRSRSWSQIWFDSPLILSAAGSLEIRERKCWREERVEEGVCCSREAPSTCTAHQTADRREEG